MNISFADLVNEKFLRPLEDKEKWGGSYGDKFYTHEIYKDIQKKRRWGGTVVELDHKIAGEKDEKKRRKIERKKIKIREENLAYSMNEYEKIINQKKYMEAEIFRMQKLVNKINILETRIEDGGCKINTQLCIEEGKLDRLKDTEYEAEDLEERKKMIAKQEEQVEELYDELNRNREDRIMREFYR